LTDYILFKVPGKCEKLLVWDATSPDTLLPPMLTWLMPVFA